MLSNKWTFSLKILVVMLSLCFVASSAMAQFEVKLSIDSAADVSHADGYQLEYGNNSKVDIKIASAKVVNFHATATAATAVLDTPVKSDTALGADDFTVIAYNKFGGTVATNPALGVVSVDGTADGMHFKAQLGQVNANSSITRVLLVLTEETVELADPRAELDAGVRKADGKNKEASIELHYVDENSGKAPGSDVDNGAPGVISIERAGDSLLPLTLDEVTFGVIVTLSEQPRATEPAKDTFTKDRFSITEAAITTVTALGAFDPVAPVNSTGRDDKIYKYLLTVTPKYENTNAIVIKILDFESQEKPGSEKYTAPAMDAARVEGTNKLTVKVGKAAPTPKSAGHPVNLTNKRVIPKDGYLIVATDLAGTGINLPKNNDADDNTPVAAERTPAQLKYNAIKVGLPNLEHFLLNGGTIDLVSPNAGLVISEIMWGSDASLDPNNNSQWIEIRNTTAADIKTGDGTHKLIFYGPNEDLPGMSVAANNIQDRVGTVGAGGYWLLTGKGRSGRTGTGETADTLAAVIPTQSIISMQRVIDTAGVAADGTMVSSWAQSTPPAVNFATTATGVRVASPGAAPVAYPVAPTPDPVVTPDPPAEAADIMITEIMVDTGGGRLPQWIELSNVSGKKVSLAGWSVEITNSDADADAVGSSVSIDLSGSLGVSAHAGNTGKGQSLLLVAWGARSSSKIKADLVMNVSSQVDETGRYTLISEMAFTVALVPPQTSGILTYGDTAGNLDEGWELPPDEGARSSLIRREMDAAGMATMGTMANGWVLASDTPLVKGPVTWYGSDEDAGTPGYDAGGPLPVELSHFRPARDDAGAVVITWSTQSELNNAGFFIKRSQQRDGEFQIINATMIAGAGTTSEKQFYTYEDTTAQPNVVYYYQIEDVSLDGNRQTLTNGIRLKGHIGAAGKLTTMWGDLKTQE